MTQSYPNLPHFSTGSAEQVTEFRHGDFGKDLDQIVMIKSTTVDAGSSPTTKLRKGLVVGFISADGKYSDLPDADAPVAASKTASGAVTWANFASTTITFKIDGGDTKTCTFGADDDTKAEVLAAFNAVDARLQMASPADTPTLTLAHAGSDHYFQLTGGTGVAELLMDLLIHRGTDMIVGILCDQLETTIDAVAYDCGPARIAIAGKVEASKVYGLDGVNGEYAKMALERSGVIFV